MQFYCDLNNVEEILELRNEIDNKHREVAKLLGVKEDALETMTSYLYELEDLVAKLEKAQKAHHSEMKEALLALELSWQIIKPQAYSETYEKVGFGLLSTGFHEDTLVIRCIQSGEHTFGKVVKEAQKHSEIVIAPGRHLLVSHCGEKTKEDADNIIEQLFGVRLK